MLLTGTTGFLGKIVLEKILRCLKDVKKIYVLVRTKRNKSTVDRVRELFES